MPYKPTQPPIAPIDARMVARLVLQLASWLDGTTPEAVADELGYKADHHDRQAEDCRKAAELLRQFRR